VDVGRRPHRVQIGLDRLFDRRVTLREDAISFAVGDRIVDQANELSRATARHERIRKKDSVSKRQESAARTGC